MNARPDFVRDWRIWYAAGVWNVQLWHATTGAIIRAPLLEFINVPSVVWVPDESAPGRGWFRVRDVECKASVLKAFQADTHADVDKIRILPITQVIEVPTIRTHAVVRRPQ